MEKSILSSDKIKEVLKAHPKLKEKLISFSPKFKKLNNKLVFNTVAKFATIKDIAKVSGKDIHELLDFLNYAIGVGNTKEIVQTDLDKVIEEPVWLKLTEFETVDGRKLDEYFLPKILKKIKKLKRNKGLCIIQSFEPIPLLSLMAKKGWINFTKKFSEDEFHVFFIHNKNSAVSESIKLEK